MTADTWVDTGGGTGTACQPRWCANHSGESALRKPGRIAFGSLEAAREVLASWLGRWIGATVPTVELLPVPPDGPCCISRAITGPAIPFGQALRAPMSPATTKAEATAALPKFGACIVLDALIGCCDRFNEGNIVFASAQKQWYSLDYAFSFNMHQPQGVGDPARAFGDVALRQVYFPEILAAVRADPSAIRQATAVASGITNQEIDGLVALLPHTHSPTNEAGTMANFLKARRSRIRDIMSGWANLAQLDGII